MKKTFLILSSVLLFAVSLTAQAETTTKTAAPSSQQKAYTLDPTRRLQTMEGWGVSLCWWANMCGKWSDEKIDEIVDWLVSPTGLNYNIFRYNIGGGDDPQNRHCTLHHMGRGKGLRAEMEGFKDSTAGPYVWSRDEAQRKIMLKIRQRRPDAIFEAFSNSCPYYMTVSGCVGGNVDPKKDNLRPDCYEEFAHYLVDVCKHYHDAYGLTFRTLEPFNEPQTDYWNCDGSQEGCHFDVSSQARFLRVLAPVVKASGLSTTISASDESLVGHAVKGLRQLIADSVIDLISQVNTHTYSGTNAQRTAFGNLGRQWGKRVWMSETGSGGRGIEGNLALAQRLIDDMRYIRPEAWVDWQYVAERDDQWCLIDASFKRQTYRKVKHYYVRQQFSRFIQPGYTMVETDDSCSLAAINPACDTLVLVRLNAGKQPMTVNVNLRQARVTGPVTVFRTSPSEDLAVVTDAMTRRGKVLSLSLPAESVTTYLLPIKQKK